VEGVRLGAGRENHRARPLCTLPPEGREREYNYFLLKRVSNFRESEYSDPYICLTDPDADPGGPKTYGSGCGSGTLLKVIKKSKTVKKIKQDVRGEMEILLEFKSPS
jgi:hypothetical protein